MKKPVVFLFVLFGASTSAYAQHEGSDITHAEHQEAREHVEREVREHERAEHEHVEHERADREPAAKEPALCTGSKANAEAGKTFEAVSGGFNPNNVDKVKSDGVREAICAAEGRAADRDAAEKAAADKAAADKAAAEYNASERNHGGGRN
jgi:hypothetical protein